ncbi:MAG: hypothetical protein U1E29_11210 [Coriobacteriia bacterium]|nr:hypothetical protein [Coriobacteriia bacterium]
MTSETKKLSTRLTINDVRHHAEEVRDMAVDQAKAIVEDNRTKGLIVGVVVVALAVSVAFYLGTRSVTCVCDD